MKKFIAISATILSLVLVGAGCSKEASETKETGSAAGAAAGQGIGPAGVRAAFQNGKISFSAKDKTAAAKAALGPDGALVSSFTEYKFEGSDLIVLIGEAIDANNRPMLGSKLSDIVKAQAAATGLEYSSIGGLNDPKWFGYVLEKEGQIDTKIKVLGTISQ